MEQTASVALHILNLLLFLFLWIFCYSSIQQCALINQYMRQLAEKFPYTKFLKAVAQTCIPNYPEKNLPSIFVYFEGDMKKQFVGPHELRGTSLTLEGMWCITILLLRHFYVKIRLHITTITFLQDIWIKLHWSSNHRCIGDTLDIPSRKDSNK